MLNQNASWITSVILDYKNILSTKDHQYIEFHGKRLTKAAATPGPFSRPRPKYRNWTRWNNRNHKICWSWRQPSGSPSPTPDPAQSTPKVPQCPWKCHPNTSGTQAGSWLVFLEQNNTSNMQIISKFIVSKTVFCLWFPFVTTLTIA